MDIEGSRAAGSCRGSPAETNSGDDQTKRDIPAGPGVKLFHSIGGRRPGAAEAKEKLSQDFLAKFDGIGALLAKIRNNDVVRDRPLLQERVDDIERADSAAGLARALFELDTAVGGFSRARLADGRFTHMEKEDTQRFLHDVQSLVSLSQKPNDQERHRILTDFIASQSFSPDVPLSDWVKPSEALLPQRPYRATAEGYAIRLILQAENDPVVFKGGVNLVGKHPESTILAQWDPATAAIRIVYNPTDCPYVRDGELAFDAKGGRQGDDDPSTVLPEQWKLTLLGHGSDDNTVAGRSGAEMAGCFLEMGAANFAKSFPGKITLMSCSGVQDETAGAAYEFMQTISRDGIENGRTAAEISRLRLSAFKGPVTTSVDGRRVSGFSLPAISAQLHLNSKIIPENTSDGEGGETVFWNRKVEFSARHPGGKSINS
ncbi:C80 family cysteine peptidase [Aestuariispira insulae]|uniref:Peptidase C80-like protein n=1 Tax=Aestuariispira insulae TaxID=1461337 RepID=A0A3D9H2K7_9PROT|nr:C80 family cysteine peptidase [Aestuariispira insulae]RED43724.1 peptidase C80-like protein [Aestuariispira insulae]